MSSNGNFHFLLWITSGELHLFLSFVVSGIKVPGVGFGPACFPFLLFFYCPPFCYAQTPYLHKTHWFSRRFFTFTHANKKGILKALFGSADKRLLVILGWAGKVVNVVFSWEQKSGSRESTSWKSLLEQDYHEVTAFRSLELFLAHSLASVH